VPLEPLPAQQPVDLDALRALGQLLIRDLAALIKQVSESPTAPDQRASIVGAVTRFQQIVATLDRVFALQPALPAVLESFRLVLRGARQAEAVLARPNLRSAWRAARDRVNAMSDMLQLPRAVSPAPAPAVPPVSRSAAALLTQLDRAIAAVASGLAEPAPLDVNDPVSARLWDQARRLQLKLFIFGQRVLAAESSSQLDGPLREIESLNVELFTRARLAAPVVPGQRRNEPLIFQTPDGEIKQLRKLLR
jgi:hypothetical protein